MVSWHIHIRGQVQGVGFRPFLSCLADTYDLQGQVWNGVDGVHIIATASEDTLRVYYKNISLQKPGQAMIQKIEWREVPLSLFSSFSIIHSSDEGRPAVMLSPDFAICSSCQVELLDPINRRYRYPFTTCTQCGPRLSILNSVPYDRPNTMMVDFAMCQTCQQEYDSINDRRYFSQTNSCPTCSIELSLSPSHHLSTNPSCIKAVAKRIQSGQIVAVKSTSGFLLLCDSRKQKVVSRLREHKQRPEKPFAVLFDNLKTARKYAKIKKESLQILSSSIRPIVLCPITASGKSWLASEEIAPGLDTIGIMIPADPLLVLLIQEIGFPVIATSGNVKGSPIIHDYKNAKDRLDKLADSILYHNRKISIPQDDSVVMHAEKSGQQIIVRRGRGFSPTLISPIRAQLPCIVSLGGDNKGSFGILEKEHIYLSPSLGNQANYDAQKQYSYCLNQYMSILKVKPAIILSDAHPGYHSHVHEKLFPKAKVETIQHHIAHFSALLFEHELFTSDEPILGVIWDGLGYGDDGNLWGGEFFKYQNGDFNRAYYFDYFPYFMGDKMSLDTRLSALAVFGDCLGAEEKLEPLFSQKEWQLYSKMIHKVDSVKTSSVGRLFDAVAGILGLNSIQNYEGQAAMQLERAARNYLKRNDFSPRDSYVPPDSGYYRISTSSIAQKVVLDIDKGQDKGYIAAKFHNSLVQIIANVAHHTGCQKLGFSGGVFQNQLLVDMIWERLSKKHKIYFHSKLSPNDENLALGQIAYFQLQNIFKKQKETTRCA
ncbi:MAG TPA: carbamoyltransferase HypF [Saprospiraceae bacterium]|nr:carbamoyltransferase HypF [Saprospiraceae bacterium]